MEQSYLKPRVKSWLAAFLTFTLGAQFLFQTALAMPNPPANTSPIINSVTIPSGEVYINVPNQVNSISFSYYFDPNEAGATVVPVTEQIKDDKDNVVYDFGQYSNGGYLPTNRLKGTFNLNWNGTYRKPNFASNGTPVPSGYYKLYLSANKLGSPVTTVSSNLFHLTYVAAPKLTLDSASATYNSASGHPYTISYNLDMGTSTSVTSELSVNNSLVKTKTENTNGVRTITWDGMNAPVGNYTYKLVTYGTVSYNNVTTKVYSNTLNGNFAVSIPPTTITNLTADHNPYDPVTQGNVTFGFDVANLKPGMSISAYVGKPFNINSPSVKSWTINAPLAHNVLTWNGIDPSTNKYAPNDNYSFFVKTNDPNPDNVVLSWIPFTLNASNPNPIPVLSNLQVSPSPYDPTKGSASLNYSISALNANLHIYVIDPNGVVQADWANVQPANTNNAILWNAPANLMDGVYTFKITGTSGNQNLAEQKITFNIQKNQNQQLPVLSNLQVSPSPYDPTKGIVATLSYNISSTNAKLNLSILSPNNSLVAQFPNIVPANSGVNANAVLWSGDSNLSEGFYVFKITGVTNDNQTIVPQQIIFQVQKGGNPVTLCAGYTDMAASDVDCPAFTWLKSKGIMTGNGDGTINLNGLLQRDQIAKIVLQSYGLFNAQNDNCQGKNPYFDITPADWSYQMICSATNQAIVTGYKAGVDAGYYRPARSVNRYEFLALITRPLPSVLPNFVMPSMGSTSYLDVAAWQWFSAAAKVAWDYNLFNGQYLNGTNFMTRREVGEVIYKLHNTLGKP